MTGDAIDFGAVPEGERAVRAVKLENPVGVPVEALAIELDEASSPDFALLRNVTSLGPGVTLDVEVRFSPVGSGEDTGALWIRSAALADGPVEITLHGGPIAVMFRIADDAAAAERLHRHALTAAVAAKLIAPSPTVETDAFIGGLLHDLGRVFMLSVASNQYRDSRGESRVRPTTLEYLVDKLHAGFSGLIAERWGFSPSLVHALLHHHLPEGGGADLVILVPPFAEELTYTLACADLVAHLVQGEDIGPEREAALTAMLEKIGAGVPEDVVVDAKDAFEALQFELGRGV